MMRSEINNYINNKCYDCCHFKKENMELYKLNLPNGAVNNIIEYNCDEEECNYCYNWKCYQAIFNNTCKQNIRNKRNVEEDVLAFLTVYDKDLPPLKDVKQVMRISEKKYEVLKEEVKIIENCQRMYVLKQIFSQSPIF